MERRKIPLAVLLKTEALLADFLGKAVSTMFFTIMILMLVQVFIRFVVKLSLPWTHELITYLFIQLTFYGSAVAIKESSHIEIDVLAIWLDKLDPEKRHRVERAVDLFRYLAIVWLCGLFAYMFYGFIIKIKIMNQMTPAMFLPKWWFDAGVFIALILMTFHASIKILLCLFDYSAMERKNAVRKGGAEEAEPC